MRSPTIVCWRTSSHSSGESGPGLSRISVGIASLPMSCSAAGASVALVLCGAAALGAVLPVRRLA